jgi:hypothetical protein
MASHNSPTAPGKGPWSWRLLRERAEARATATAQPAVRAYGGLPFEPAFEISEVLQSVP